MLSSIQYFVIMVKLIWILPIAHTALPDIGQNPLVSIKQGLLKGKTMISNNGREFEAFLGIPYGKVTGRFKKPQPGEPWKGVFDATQDGLSCKQYKLMGKNSTTEDCLTINVYVRKNFTEDPMAATPLLPVLVYIYGGGFVGGVSTSKAYGPGRFMDGVPIVLVLFNYRTGSFGFLSTNDEASPGNFGLLDQVMALQWIRDNIKSFGGNPSKVTISGESAGSASVMLHVMSPLSKDLFHGAIAQSGQALCPWVTQMNPLNITRKIAKKLGCPTEESITMVECLRNVDADDLIIASNLSDIIEYYSMSTVPVIDGHFLTDDPIKLLEEGRFNKVPIISGVTADETVNVFKAILSQRGNFLKLLREKKVERFLSSFTQDKFEYLNNDTITNSIIEMYFHGTNAENSIVGAIEFTTDFLFNSCNDKAVRLLAASGTPVYMYVFDYSSRDISDTNFTGRPDVGHTSELNLLFYRNSSKTREYSDETKRVSKDMVNLWTNFATYGNPTPSGQLIWSPVLPAERLKYLNISLNFEMLGI